MGRRKVIVESHGSNRDLTVAHLQRGLNSGTSNGVIVLPSAEPLHREKDSLAVYIDANLFARDVILVAGERRLLARSGRTVRTGRATATSKARIYFRAVRNSLRIHWP